MAGKKAVEALTGFWLRAAAMDRMEAPLHVRAGEFFPIRRGRTHCVGGVRDG